MKKANIYTILSKIVFWAVVVGSFIFIAYMVKLNSFRYVPFVYYTPIIFGLLSSFILKGVGANKDMLEILIEKAKEKHE